MEWCAKSERISWSHPPPRGSWSATPGAMNGCVRRRGAMSTEVSGWQILGFFWREILWVGEILLPGRWQLKDFCSCSSPTWGKWFPISQTYFSNGLVQPPTSSYNLGRIYAWNIYNFDPNQLGRQRMTWHRCMIRYLPLFSKHTLVCYWVVLGGTCPWRIGQWQSVAETWLGLNRVGWTRTRGHEHWWYCFIPLQ